MKKRVEDWTVEELHKERSKISFPEYQRQPNLWSKEKKSLLIDSILLDLDIPKLYFNKTGGGDNYDVVDGQQRLWALWEFLDDAYQYTDHGRPLTFSKLSVEQKSIIRRYKLQVTVLQDAEDDYLRELFLRLQLGLLLITGEKLNAATGMMRDFVFKKAAAHPFVAGLGVPHRRFARETLAAQISINSFTRAKLGSFARTRYEDLLQFFKEYEHPIGNDLELFHQRSNRILIVLGKLFDDFGTRTHQLRSRSYILSVYLLFEDLLGDNPQLSLKDRRLFVQFVFALWSRLKEETKSGIDRRNRELYLFETLVSSAPGEKYQIERRHQKMHEYYVHFKETGKIKGDR